MKWISVEERLPDEKMNCVIIFIDSDKMSEWAQQDEDNQRFYDDNFSTSVDIWNPVAVNHWAKQAVPRWITHWMPLPDPPVEYPSSPQVPESEGQRIVREAFDALTPERKHEIMLDIGIDDGYCAEAEADFCVCDYRPRRKCSVHPVGSEVKPRTGDKS